MKKEERDEYNKTYGLYKFKRPLPSEVQSAMGLVGESILFKKLISADYERFYEAIIPSKGEGNKDTHCLLLLECAKIVTAFLEGRSVICIKMKCADTLVIPLVILGANQLCKG